MRRAIRALIHLVHALPTIAVALVCLPIAIAVGLAVYARRAWLRLELWALWDGDERARDAARWREM